jgi:uncharacterized protein (TIGR00730 family)
MNVCVFAGASPRVAGGFLDLARETGRVLARAGHRVIFGGGAHGCMGALADGVIDRSGSILGILPEFLFDREPPHPGVRDIRVVASMHERKAAMYEVSDAFLVLPGGFGTLDETMEIVTWRQLALHSKEVVFVGPKGFWEGLESTFDVMARHGFLSERDRSLVAFVETPEDAVTALA